MDNMNIAISLPCHSSSTIAAASEGGRKGGRKGGRYVKWEDTFTTCSVP